MAWQQSGITDIAVASADRPSPPAVVTASEVDIGAPDPAYGLLPLPLVFVLSALTFAAWRQGAYYGHHFATVELVVAGAAVVAVATAVVAARRGQPKAEISSRDVPFHRLGPTLHFGGLHMVARWAPSPAIAAAAGLAATTAVSGVLHHQLRAASPTFGILAASAVLVSLVGTSSCKVQQTLVAGLIGVGVLVAATGWWGVAAHRWPWSLVDGGLWRAASTVTYANATAAVCVPLALVALSQLALVRSPAWSLAATVLLVGAAATLSRAGALAFAVGLIVLASFHGVVALAGAVWPAAFGAVLAAAGLATSFPATHNGVATSGHPGVASATAAVGMAFAFAGTRYWPRLGTRLFSKTPRVDVASAHGRNRPQSPAWRRAGFARPQGRYWLVLAMLAVAAAGLVAVSGPAVRKDRLSAQSPDRTREWRATWDLARTHAWTGVGPGSFAASWTTAGGEVMTAEYAHNEYLQLAAQQGVLGTAAMALGLGGLAWLVWRRRPRRRGGETTAEFARWAGAAAALSALAVHSAFDFLWHIPLIPLMGAALVGIVLATPTAEVM